MNGTKKSSCCLSFLSHWPMRKQGNTPSRLEFHMKSSHCLRIIKTQGKHQKRSLNSSIHSRNCISITAFQKQFIFLLNYWCSNNVCELIHFSLFLTNRLYQTNLQNWCFKNLVNRDCLIFTYTQEKEG